MKVLIGGPVRQDPDIFEEYLKSLRQLELPEGCTTEFYFIFNDCDLSHLLEPGEGYELVNTGDEYRCSEKSHHWSGENLSKMPQLRNRMLEKAAAEGFDAYFLVDSDLILFPHTLKLLLEQDKDLVSALFWTEAEPDSKRFWANAWEYDQCETRRETQWKWVLHRGCYPCGGTGACFLIRRSVWEAGVNYDPLHNLRCLWGEDRWFCIRAVAHGFSIWTDSRCPPLHLYRRSIYEHYKEGIMDRPFWGERK